jgi:hypothetical protein
MEIRIMAFVALLGSAGPLACTEKKPPDSSGGDESDADTDADTDSDTDTDPDSWHANTIAVEFGFAWDSAKGEVATVTAEGAPLRNYAQVTMYNDDKLSGSGPHQFCFFVWDLPDGTLATDDRYASYWMGVDLSTITPTYTDESSDGEVGDCEHLGGFIDAPRGDGETLEDFITGLEFGVGVGSFEMADAKTVNDWDSYWRKLYEADYGVWEDVDSYFGLGGFTTNVPALDADAAPAPLGVTFAYLVGKDWAVVYKDELAVAIALGSVKTAPTGYYKTLSLYAFGTGF